MAALEAQLADTAQASASSGADAPVGTSRTQLRENLERTFSLEELATLCFDLGLDFESLPGSDKAGKARELVTYLERRGRIPDLIAVCRARRPNVAWE